MRLLKTCDVLFVGPTGELLPKDSNMVCIGAKELISDNMLRNLSLVRIDDAIPIEIKSLG